MDLLELSNFESKKHQNYILNQFLKQLVWKTEQWQNKH